MKSLLSCLTTLLVLAVIAAGAFLLYRELGKGGSGPALGVGAAPTLTLHNETRHVLTVTLTGPGLERLQLAPGASESRSLRPGTYRVEGRISDPATDPFTGEWTFEQGATYESGFRRDGEKVLMMVLRPEGAGADGGGRSEEP